MNRYFKSAAETLLPQRAFITIQSIRSRNYQMRLHKELGIYQATLEMIEKYGRTVLEGPFRGMRYPEGSLVNRDGIPLIFGTYELELHPVIEEVASNRYDCIVDIGSAEGFYAVGLALRTKTRVHAFDCEPRERHYLKEMAQLNGVADLIRTRSWCGPKMLSKLVCGRQCLVISDCEGFEFDLFTDECAAALRASDVVIELHEFGSKMGRRNELLNRFQGTHSNRTIRFSPDYLGSSIPEKWQKFAREFRYPEQQWFYFKSAIQPSRLGADSA